MAKRSKGEGGTIVIKRIEEGGHAHHGGAWKVAYADFVTAMMAFFLLMWLLNATTEQQRRGLADYFNPTHAMATGAAGLSQPFGGRTPHSTANMASDSGSVRVERGPRPVMEDVEDEDDTQQPAEPVPRRQAPPGPDEQAAAVRSMTAERQGLPATEARLPAAAEGPTGESDAARMTDRVLRAELGRREQAAFEAMATALRQDPALAEVARQTLIEVVPEGLRIQLLEADGQPMFATGNSQPSERARAAIRAVAQAALRLPNPIGIAGHTDATPFRNANGAGTRSNWDLSAERANAARRLLQEAGIPDTRLAGVTAMAEREPLLPATPQAAGNRRVAITLLRQVEAPKP